jgi:O-antigen ligase
VLKLEKLFLIFALLYFAGGLSPSDLAENQHSHDIDRVNSLLQLAVFPILLGLYFAHWRRLSAKRSTFILPVLFCALTVVSAVWSDAPGFSLRRSVIMFGLTMFALYLGLRFSLPEQINLYGWMAVTFVLGSYLLAWVMPEWALTTGNHWGSWKGVFGHKNTLGRMGLFAAVVLFTGRPTSLPVVLRWLAAGGAVGLTVLSGSATSLMAAGVLAAIWPCLPILKIRRQTTLPLWVALLPLGTLMLLGGLANFGLILQTLGRDPTLTGRTTLWNAITEVGAKRPFLGFGYSSFWHYNGADRAALYSQVGWTPPHAHNAYLDMWLDLGYVGLALLIYTILSLFLKAARLYRLTPNRAGTFPIMFVFFVVLANCTESDLFRTHSFLWVPFVSIYAGLKLLEENRPSASWTRRRASDSTPKVSATASCIPAVCD